MKKNYKSKTFNHGLTINFTSMVFTILIIFFLVCMISSPDKFIEQSLDGISAWAFNVLPSVLPFMFFTKVLSSLGTMQKLTRPFSPLSWALFRTPSISIYTFFMAILSGYPVGSKMVADLYSQGQISKPDAYKMTSFCSTSGPMFIVGAVGIGMFHSSKIGYILFISHLFGAVLNGILYRNLKIKNTDEPYNFVSVNNAYPNNYKQKIEQTKKSRKNKQNKNQKEQIVKYEQTKKHEQVKQQQTEQQVEQQVKQQQTEQQVKQQQTEQQVEQQTKHKSKPTKQTNQAERKNSEQKFNLSDIVVNSTISILSVGCIITIFFIVIACFSPILSLLPKNLAYFLEGVIEITKGCLDISTLNDTLLSVTLCSFVISFGGISTILQSITMLKSLQMPVKLLMLQKFTHAIFSMLITILILLII